MSTCRICQQDLGPQEVLRSKIDPDHLIHAACLPCKDAPCPKSLDPTEPWGSTCFCYAAGGFNLITTYVVISDCGLNGYVMHYAGQTRPDEENVRQQWANRAGHYTGYQNTSLWIANDTDIHYLGYWTPR